jgi:DNA invertase Pin-like site-specific DNA recombinase
MQIIAYYRVSTDQQGRSGLGLEAQRNAVERYAASIGATIAESFTEIESGKRNDRPELGRAVKAARITGRRLVIAKLDRLSRNAAFLLNLRDSGVDFVAADMPSANRITVGVMALVAEEEGAAISRRTREALAAAKRRGVKLGNPQGAEPLRRAGKGNAAAVATVQTQADQRAAALREILSELQAAGLESLGAIAEALNARGVRTPRGRQWHRSTVASLLRRVHAGAV